MKCKEECYLQSDWHLCKCAETCKTVWFLSLLSPTSSLYHGVYVFPQRVFSSSCFFLLHTADNSDICLSNELLSPPPPSSPSPWHLDVSPFSPHHEWCCAGRRGRGRLLLGALPPAALRRPAETAADGPAGHAAGLVPVLPHRLHPAAGCQHGMKPLQHFKVCINLRSYFPF